MIGLKCPGKPKGGSNYSIILKLIQCFSQSKKDKDIFQGIVNLAQVINFGNSKGHMPAVKLSLIKAILLVSRVRKIRGSILCLNLRI